MVTWCLWMLRMWTLVLMLAQQVPYTLYHLLAWFRLFDGKILMLLGLWMKLMSWAILSLSEMIHSSWWGVSSFFFPWCHSNTGVRNARYLVWLFLDQSTAKSHAEGNSQQGNLQDGRKELHIIWVTTANSLIKKWAMALYSISYRNTQQCVKIVPGLREARWVKHM